MSRPSREGSAFDPLGRRQAVTSSQGPYNTQPNVNWAVKARPGLEPPTVNSLCAGLVDKENINASLFPQMARQSQTDRQTDIWGRPKTQEILHKT